MRLLRFQHADQGFQLVRRCAARFHLGAHFLHRLRHPLLVEGLEQVVNSVYFERLDRVLVKGGGENDLGKGDFLVEQFLDHAKAIEAGHLHVEKDQVGVVLADQVDAFEPVFALGHDVHVADIFQQEGKFVTGKLFIVHDDCGQRHSNS